MSDTYQAIYDAVRSKISNGDIGHAIQQAIHLDGSFQIEQVKQEFLNSAYEMQRPSVLYRPSISKDGDQWCALYGKDLQNGVNGFGNTPSEAMTEFDKNWNAK